MINGILNVYKEPGYTSFDVVAKLRGILKQKKIGHTGTLDPMAEGVLVVCLGTATKLVDMLTIGSKTYRANMLLGKTTDTEDITGKVLETKEVNVSPQEVEETVLGFVGSYEQIPPMYSAIKKDGKKLYEYARAGIEVEREARKVEIYSIDHLSVDLPEISFDVHCSKGTYIRSLCRDIGEKLSCGGVLTGLARNEVHGFKEKDALRLEEIKALKDEGKLMEHILPMDTLLKGYPAVEVKKQYQKLLQNGNRLHENQFEHPVMVEENISYNDMDTSLKVDVPVVRVYSAGKFMALYYRENESSGYKPYKMFLE